MNEIELLPVAHEIQHIVDFVNRYMKLWNKENLFIINNNTPEDKAFIEIYNHNKDKLGNLIIIEDNKDNNIKEYENTIIIDTDTYLLRQTKLDYIKNNYTLNVFIDYSPEYIKEILSFYKIDLSTLEPTNYGLSEKLLNAFREYLNNTLDVFKMDNKLRLDLIRFLKKRNLKTNKNIINSYNLSQYNKVNED